MFQVILRGILTQAKFPDQYNYILFGTRRNLKLERIFKTRSSCLPLTGFESLHDISTQRLFEYTDDGESTLHKAFTFLLTDFRC